MSNASTRTTSRRDDPYSGDLVGQGLEAGGCPRRDAMEKRAPVWQMIKEACDALGDRVITYPEIKQHIWNAYGAVNEGTINAQIIVCNVNQPPRAHYPENHRPRAATSQY